MPTSVMDRKLEVLKLANSMRACADTLIEECVKSDPLAFSTEELEIMFGNTLGGMCLAILKAAARCDCEPSRIIAGINEILDLATKKASE